MTSLESVKAIRFNPQYQKAFMELNLEWIRKYFHVEPMDIEQLENPQKSILDPGGEIFFVLENGVPVGTCAMIPHGEACYELAKMAVSPLVQGKGYGDLLMKEAIAWAKEKKAEKILLISNTRLAPALALYKKHGFETTFLGQNPDYKRGDIEMQLSLQLTGASKS